MKTETRGCIYYIGKFKLLWDEECIARSFEELGFKVIRREEGANTNKEFLSEIEKLQPDFVLFAKLNTREDSNELVAGIKKLGIKTVCWIFDLYIGYRREYLVPHAGYFKADYVFTTDGGHQKEFKKYKINHIVLRQGIYEPEAFMLRPMYIYDVIFVGSQNNSHPTRQRTLEWVDRNYKFRWFGRNDQNEVRSKHLNYLLSQAKVVLGDSVPSDNYWSNRVYETLGRGGFLIHTHIKGMEKEFVDKEHLVFYKAGDLLDLKQKLDYYLTNDRERERIKKSGFEFTKNNYGYKKRCQEMLEHLNIGTVE